MQNLWCQNKLTWLMARLLDEASPVDATLCSEPQVPHATPNAEGVAAAEGVFDLAAPLSEGRGGAVTRPSCC